MPREPKDAPERRQATVRTVTWRGHLKHLRFGHRSSPLVVPRSACVSKGDPIVFSGPQVSVACKNGSAKIAPAYVALERLEIGNLSLEFVIKEITETDEWTAYESLAAYHYRSHSLHGRTAKLIVLNFAPFYPSVVGYVELATPFYMNKPRSLILDAPFRSRSVSWKNWDIPTMRKYIHVIVRIARCVIYPEFRGIGLGTLLLKHAGRFARERWQVSRLKPCFLEISADMLKYVPFANAAGMHFVGETEGNLNRVAKDMHYLMKNRRRVKKGEIVREDSCGIVDQQVARMEHTARLMKEQKWTLHELRQRLSRLSTTTVLRDYDLFHGIISLPKPTYVMGLTPSAESFLEKRLVECSPERSRGELWCKLERVKGTLRLENVSLSYRSGVRRTKQTHAVQQAFGISPDEIVHKVIDRLSLKVSPGEVVLVAGSSGSGKSTLMRLLEQRESPGLEGDVHWPDTYRPTTFEPFRSSKALIEILGVTDVGVALHLLGVVGLSDAFVYLKRYRELSNGQQYRAMLARAISDGNNVWLADEFCANLDPLTANIVADRIQRVTREMGAMLVVASSQPATFAAALRPDKVVQLSTSWEHRVLNGDEFLRACSTRALFSPPILRISREYLPVVRSGAKTTTVRRGRRRVQPGFLLLQGGDQLEPVQVIGTQFKQVRTLSEDDAKSDGFMTLRDLKRALRRHYPGIAETSWVTVVRFRQSCSTMGHACGGRANGVDNDR